MIFRSIGIILVSIVVCGIVGFLATKIGVGLGLYGTGGGGAINSSDLEMNILALFEVLIGSFLGMFSGSILAVFPTIGFRQLCIFIFFLALLKPVSLP